MVPHKIYIAMVLATSTPHMQTPEQYFYLIRIWVKVFKNGPSTICERQLLKNFKWYGLSASSDQFNFKVFKGCLQQILLRLFLNNLTRGNSKPKLRPALGRCHWWFIFSKICFIKSSVNMLWTQDGGSTLLLGKSALSYLCPTLPLIS